MTSKEILAQSEKALKLKNYSRKTIKAYLGHLRRFMEYAEYRRYIAQVINALKVVYNDVLKAGIDVDFPVVKRERKLPDILSKDEVLRIIASVSNI